MDHQSLENVTVFNTENALNPRHLFNLLRFWIEIKALYKACNKKVQQNYTGCNKKLKKKSRLFFTREIKIF